MGFRSIKEERGAGIVMVVLLITVLTSMTALVVGNGRQQEISVKLQAVVDSAALAGASALTGDRQGWLASKRKALDVVRVSDVPWVRKDALGSIALDQGEGDAYEERSILYGYDDPFSGTEGVLENFSIKIERGLYWKSESGSFQFTSIEDTELDESGTRRLKYGVDAYVIANAIKVTAELNDVAAFLPNFIGHSKLGTFKREAVAVADPDSLSACVFPVAIKVCDAMYSQEGGEPFTTADPEYEGQCNRQIFAAEADPDKAPTAVREGRTRAEKQQVTYKQANDYSLDVNGELRAVKIKRHDLAFPVGATIGLPSRSGASEPLTPDELVSVLGQGCIKASVGQFLKPMEDTQSFLGQSDVQQAFEQLISSNPAFEHPTFGETYCNSPDCEIKKGGKRNFPYLSRWKDPVTVGKLGSIKWPVGVAPDNEVVFDTIYTGRYQRLEAQNPMCNAEGLPDGPAAPVAKGYVMLVAAGDDESSYCDYSGVVQGQNQPRIDPTDHQTKPRIVGFVEAVFHDTNVLELFDKYDEDGNLNESIPYGRQPIKNDLSPAAIPVPGTVYYQMQQYYADVMDYELEHAAWQAECGGADVGEQVCVACTGTPGNCDVPGACNQACPEGTSGDNLCGMCACTETDTNICDTEPVPPDVPEDLEVASGEEWKDECFEIRACPSEGRVADNGIPIVGPIINANFQQCTNMTAINPKLYAKKGKKCLPQRRRGKFVLNDPASYEPPRHLSPGYGCGGLVGKLTCNPDQTTFGDVPKSQQKPGLVS